MGNRVPPDRRVDALSQSNRPDDIARRLRELSGPLVISGSGDPHDRNQKPSARSTEPSQLQLLTELLEFVVAEKSPEISTDLLAEFGTLADILSAPAERLAQSLPNAGSAAAYLSLIGSSLLEVLRIEAMRGPEIRTGDELLNYLFADMARKNAEEFRVLYLDARRALIADEVSSRGSLSEVAVHTREIVKRGLDLGAKRLILVHNHPSGDPQPSEADLRMTRELEQACRWFEIIVDDHLIFGRTGSVSLRRRGLL